MRIAGYDAVYALRDLVSESIEATSDAGPHGELRVGPSCGRQEADGHELVEDGLIR
jgi:hypothetical protein